MLRGSYRLVCRVVHVGRVAGMLRASQRQITFLLRGSYQETAFVKFILDLKLSLTYWAHSMGP